MVTRPPLQPSLHSLALPSLLMMAVATPLQAQDGRATFVLPDGPGIRQAKLSGPVPETYRVVCDSLVDDACEVLPGTYQLQTFDLEWSGTISTVTVAGGSVPPVIDEPGERPAAPANVRFRFYSTTAGALSWDRPATPNLRYEVRRDGETVVDATSGINFVEREARLLDRGHLYEIIAITPDNRRSEPARYFLRSYLDNPDPLNDPAPLPSDERLAAPANLRFDFYSTFAGALSWDRPATPRLRYEVRRNDQTVFDGTDGTNYQERNARFVDTRYVYEVIATAPDGRRSAPSVLTIDDFEQTSGPGPDPDQDGPEAPADLRADVYSRTGAELFWTRSATPNLRYEVSRNGQPVGTTDGTSFYDDGLAGGTTYRYEVVALDSGRRSTASSIEVVTPGSAEQSGPRVAESLFANMVAGDVIDLVKTVSGYYEASPLLSDERPYFDELETSNPYVFADPDDPESREIPGRSSSVLVDIDATGTGTFGNVFTYRDLDTRQLTEQIATRLHDGTSVAWAGSYYRNDSSSARLEEIEFTTDIRSEGERTRRQSGSFASDDRGRLRTSVDYDLTVETVDGSDFCVPLGGVITFDSSSEDFVDTTSRIEKREGDRFWTVTERFLDGRVDDEFLIADIGLTTFCDFPEL